MKRIHRIARIGLFALILSLGTLAALIADEAQGLALADLSGAPVQVMTAARGDVLYAALSGGQQAAGIYRSEDNGSIWQRVGAGPGVAMNAVVALPAQPQGGPVLYAGTPGGPAATTHSLWLSNDGGRTWQPSVLGLPANPEGLIPTVSALAVDPWHPETFYVGTDGQGVYRFEASADSYGYELVGGVSLHHAHVKSMVVGAEGRVVALTNDGLLAAEGNAWQKLPLPEMAASLAVAPGDPEILVVGGVSTGIYRSTDGGQSWERASAGLDIAPGAALRVTALAVDERNPKHLAAATSCGLGNQFTPGSVYESKDGGHRWTKLADAEGVVRALTLNQGGVYVVTERGLARYGEPIAPATVRTFPRLAPGLPPLRDLADPSGVQVLILTLTLALAGLALVGRTEWVLKNSS